MTISGSRKEDDAVPEALTYQTALRAIGAWLDSRGAGSSIRIFETTDGFVVQQDDGYQPGVDSTQTITFDEVWALAEDKRYRRRSRREYGGFQNLLRAIGRELDEAEAHSILLEQVGEDVLLTYVYPRYGGGVSLLKHFTVMVPQARQDLLRAAQGRRKPGKLTQGLAKFIADA